MHQDPDQDPNPNPDPLVRGMDPRIRIRGSTPKCHRSATLLHLREWLYLVRLTSLMVRVLAGPLQECGC
jgi:hypothetical protein